MEARPESGAVYRVAISIALQYGVPLETYVSKFTNMRFDPAGMTDDPDIRMAQSVMDYIFRRLVLDYLPRDQREALGILSADERTATVEAAYGSPSVSTPLVDEEADVEALAQSVPVEPHPATQASQPPSNGLAFSDQTAVDAPLCSTCGVKMRPAGSCYVCESCGRTSGCS